MTRQDIPTSDYSATGKPVSAKVKATTRTQTQTSRDLTATTTTPGGNKTSYEYNANNTVKKTTQTLGPSTAYTYDTFGNVLTTQVGSSTLYTKQTVAYDSTGNFKASEIGPAIVSASQSPTVYEYYDDSDLLEKVTDPLENVTEYDYDDRFRQTSVKSGNITNHYNYTPKDELKYISHNGFRYVFGYDDFGNQESISVANGSGGSPQTLVSYEYNANNGKLKSTTYGNGHVVKPEYDIYERVISESYTNTSQPGATPTPASETTYDGDGNVFQYFDKLNHLRYDYVYDSVGRPRRQAVFNDANAMQYEFEKTYDSAGRTALVWYSVGGDAGKNYVYTYNTDDLPKKTTLPDKSVLDYVYDTLRRPDVIKYTPRSGATSNLLSTKFTYKKVPGNSAQGTPLVNTYQNMIGTAVQASYTYEYDALGNITKITDKAGKTITYTYDRHQRLTREDNLVLNKTWVYTYDNGGNISSVTEGAYSTAATPSGTVTNYGYADTWKDQLTGYSGSSRRWTDPVTNEPCQFLYDELGNPTVYLGQKLEWQYGRQLKKVNNNITYTYTPDGTRLSKTVNGTKTEYTLDGSLILRQKTGNEVLNFYYDSAGKLVELGYVNGTAAEVYYFVGRNSQGDITELYHSSAKNKAELIGTYTYDSWGKPTNPSGVSNDVTGVTPVSTNTTHKRVLNLNPFRYRGYYYDTETGWYYLQSRYYDPEVRRFINADGQLNPVTGPIGLNLYAYCNNDPVNKIDPSGRIFVALAMLIYSVLGGGQEVHDSDSITNAFINSPAMQDTIKSHIAIMKESGASTYSMQVDEATIVSSLGTSHNLADVDLYLGPGTINYNINIEKTTLTSMGTKATKGAPATETAYNVTVSMRDSYIFYPEKTKFTGVVHMLNEAAYMLQEDGIIVPYYWNIEYSQLYRG